MTIDPQAVEVNRRQLFKLALVAVVATPSLPSSVAGSAPIAEPTPGDAASPSRAADAEPAFVIENDYPYFGPPPE